MSTPIFDSTDNDAPETRHADNSLWARLMALWHKPEIRQLTVYVFIGGLTTAVYFAAYYAFTRGFAFSYEWGSVSANVLAVTFAYITNKRFVFRSHCNQFTSLLREMGTFFLARTFTIVLDFFGTHVFCTRLGWSDLWVKVALTLVILVLNYVFSKWFVFLKKDKN